MTFTGLRDRLTNHLLMRVRSGEITERSLARLCRLSQSHVHHVLKGKRALSFEAADQILLALHIELLDLVEPGELLDWQRRT